MSGYPRLLIVIHHLMVAVRPDMFGGTRGLTALPAVVLGAQPNFWLSFSLMFAIAIGLWYVARSDVGGCF